MENFDKKGKGKDENHQIQKLKEYLKICVQLEDDVIETMIQKDLQKIEITYDRIKYNYFKFALKISKRLARFFID